MSSGATPSAFAQFNAHGLDLLRGHVTVAFDGLCREKFNGENLRKYASLECSFVVKMGKDEDGDDVFKVYDKKTFADYFRPTQRPTAATLGEAGFPVVEAPRP